MHELGITQNILDLAVKKAEEAGASEILKVDLVIGEMTGIVEDCVRFYFDFLSKGTAAEKASLSINMIPVKVQCKNCGHAFSPDETSWTCPRCQGTGTEIMAGKELFVESIEVE
jgi:hydrogenase nickel incorporation protein HypA/HybF